MNYATLATTEKEYKTIIKTLAAGYKHAGVHHRPNPRVVMALRLEYATGMRMSDIVRLRQCDIVKDGNHYRLDLKEKKTQKQRFYRVSEAVRDMIDDYCAKRGKSSTDMIIGGTVTGIEKQLRQVVQYLGYNRISTHSLRKYAACDIYEQTGYNIAAVSKFLNHASTSTTLKYISSADRALDEVLETRAV